MTSEVRQRILVSPYEEPEAKIAVNVIATRGNELMGVKTINEAMSKE